mgnify:FL=1|tara:strand:- start:204 stop:443 length:240 start_codon:yes stop_codon:yes gene_type:complete
MNNEIEKYNQKERAVAKATKNNMLLKAALILQSENSELKVQNELLQTKVNRGNLIADARKVSNVKANQRKTPTRYGGSR